MWLSFLPGEEEKQPLEVTSQEAIVQEQVGLQATQCPGHPSAYYAKRTQLGLGQLWQAKDGGLHSRAEQCKRQEEVQHT